MSTSSPAPPPKSRPWEKWIRGVGFGVFVLAALGIFFYALSIKKLEPNWENLRPYVLGVLSTGVLLLILTYGMGLLKKVPGPKWLGQWLQVVLAVLFVISVAAVVFWFVVLILRDAGILSRINEEATPAPAPTQFTCAPYETCYDPSLPVGIFGNAQNSGKPRQWMDTLEEGACAELKVQRAPQQVSLRWYLTEEFHTGLRGDVLYASIGTDRNAVVLAFLLFTEGYLKLTPLQQLQEQGPRAEYRFNLPESSSRSRLLVFVAMKVETYDAIRQDPKFLLRTRPFTSFGGVT